MNRQGRSRPWSGARTAADSIVCNSRSSGAGSTNALPDTRPVRASIAPMAQHPEQFVEDGLGDDELVLLFEDAPQGCVATAPRKDQSRNENVGVEDDLHSAR